MFGNRTGSRLKKTDSGEFKAAVAPGSTWDPNESSLIAEEFGRVI